VQLKRDLRYTVEANDTSKLVRFHDFQKTEHTCRVKDYSRTGVSFYLEDGSLLQKIGDIIPDLRFYSNNKQVHSSASTIIHVQDEDVDGKVVSCIGSSYIDRLMDIYSIVREDKIFKLQSDFQDFIQSLAIEENLDPDFVNLTSHLHYVLEEFENRLARELEKIGQEDEDLQDVLTKTLRDIGFNALNEELNRYYGQFMDIIGRFTDPKQSFIHREFFQKRLKEFFCKSKLCHRSTAKPLGYAGDYEMMNIVYRNAFEGEDLFSQIMNKVDCEGTASKAVRNRRFFLFTKLRELILDTSHNHDHDLKIMSVACGPALEFYDLLRSFEGVAFSTGIEFIAIDQDLLALEDAQNRIEEQLKEFPHIKAHFEQDNIKRLIVDTSSSKELYANADFIYTAGLFDYLSDRASSRLIQKLYGFLRPGGVMVIGNFGLYNPQRFIMEFGGEWFLIYRSEEELKGLAAGLPGNPHLTVEKEPEGVNLFLSIVKPGGILPE
jgi:extracellular factor (EF) 3-hydroxypalmitic acid methyl ester biosynthesis protein